MNEEIKRLNEQKTLYQAQLISQKEETAAARNTLKEAAIEIERIVMSKKTLLEDWKKSIFGMVERDKPAAPPNLQRSSSPTRAVLVNLLSLHETLRIQPLSKQATP